MTSEADLPLVTPLYQHQEAAVEKFSQLRVGALFMEAGTGKTRIALELAFRRLRSGRAKHLLWFCPASTMRMLAEDIAKHAPGVAIHEFSRRTEPGRLPATPIHLIGIESLSRSSRVFECCQQLAEDSFMVLHGSHLAKNHLARRTRRLCALAEHAAYRLILTGTEITQGIEELYSQFAFLSKKILGYAKFHHFAHYHLEYWEGYPRKIQRRFNSDYLLARIAPYVYRISKEECLDLPEKVYLRRSFPMTPEQRDRYQQAKKNTLFAVPSFTWDEAVIYKLFTSLQRVVSGHYPDPQLKRLIPIFEPLENPRIRAMLEILTGIRSDRKVIVWCKFIKEIQDCEAALRHHYGPDSYALFHGGLGRRERHEEIQRFKEGGARFFISSQACHESGPSLAEASEAIYYSNVFKMSQRLQSEGLCHCHGQRHTITYHDIICESSIDDIIMHCQNRRQNVIGEFKEKLAIIRRIKNRRVARNTLEKELEKL